VGNRRCGQRNQFCHCCIWFASREDSLSHSPKKKSEVMSHKESRERYEKLRRQWPKLFVNPPDAGYIILFEPSLVGAAEAEERARLVLRNMPESWASTGVVYEDPYMLVVRDAVRRPDGSLGTYVRTVPASGWAGAAILPLIDGKAVLLRHFRHATRTWHLEIPRGFGDPGVSGADQARQELREEIGADTDSLISLGFFHSNTGAASDNVELFLAEIHRLGEPQTSEGICQIETFPTNQFADLIGSGTVSDSFTIGAFTRAWLRGLLPGLAAPTPPR
jgi:ADP-ribose pyrophosphatase